MSGLTSMIRNIKKAEKLLVSPLVLDFLERVPDGVVWDKEAYEVFEALTQKAMGNDDRSGRFGASSRGTCPRAQIFTYLGIPEEKILPPELKNLFNDGKWRHLRWQMMALQAKAITHAEYSYAYPELRVAGSADGVHTEKEYGFELKGDRNWSRALTDVPRPHLLQTHTMMLALDYDTFSYVIEDKSSQQFREIIVHRDENVMNEIEDELEYLNECIDYERLPPVLSACQAKEGPYRKCPFAIFCLEQQRQGDHWPDA